MGGYKTVISNSDTTDTQSANSTTACTSHVEGHGFKNLTERRTILGLLSPAVHQDGRHYHISSYPLRSTPYPIHFSLCKRDICCCIFLLLRLCLNRDNSVDIMEGNEPSGFVKCQEFLD